MAKFISQELEKDGDIYKGKHFDLAIIPSPAISADWLEEKFDYDGYVFLSKHAAESGVLALTCHNTGNFSDADLVVIDVKFLSHTHIFKNHTFRHFGALGTCFRNFK